MKLHNISILFLCTAFLCGCNTFHRKHSLGTAVELNGHSLYWSALDSLTMGMSSEDSARAANAYIRQWATDILEYDKAKDMADPQIEALVEDYRRSLYVHAYEDLLVERKMPTKVADSVVAQIYHLQPEKFILQESIVKGVLLVVPQNAPHLKRVKQWLEQPEDNIEDIEKYAYRYATGYELFTDRWLTEQQILLYIPFVKDDLNPMLKQKRPLEVSDSTSLYTLQVTDKHLVGEQTPIDYARPEIEKVVLSRRQVDFLKSERDKLYDDAVLFQKIRFYDRD